MTNFVLLNRILRKSADNPRLMPTGGVDAGTRPDSLEDCDLRFEDALLDSRLDHLLQSEYGSAQPPPDAYKKVLLAIESNKKSKASERKMGLEPIVAFGHRLSQAVYNSVLKPSGVRIVSGAVTLVVMAAVIGPYLSMITGPSSRELRPSDNVLSYNYQALRQSDPPEQYGPVPQTKLYLGSRQPDPTRGELHKE